MSKKNRAEDRAARAAEARAAQQRGVDGGVAGHIHTAEFRLIDGVEYYNDGDWVEGCTALVEHFDGRMEILHWADEIARRDRQPAAASADWAEPMLEAAE